MGEPRRRGRQENRVTKAVIALWPTRVVIVA